MKLKDVIKYFDMLIEVRIWLEGEDDEPVFKGFLMNIPWYFIEYELDASDEYGGFDVYTDEETNRPCLGIYLIEE